MSISEQGLVAINAYEHANAAAWGAKHHSECYAMKLMVEHLHTTHGFGPRKIGKLVGIKYPLVEKMLCLNHGISRTEK